MDGREYLDLISRSRSKVRVATYIRAYACAIANGSFYAARSNHAIEVMVRGEKDARDVEACKSSSDVRKLLKERGYI